MPEPSRVPEKGHSIFRPGFGHHHDSHPSRIDVQGANASAWLAVLRNKRTVKRRKKINKGGSLSVQACHDMLTALADADKKVGGTGNAQIAFNIQDNEDVKDAERPIPAPDPPLQSIYGPWLNFVDTDLDANQWVGNVMVVYHESHSVPKLFVENRTDGKREIQAEFLETNICGTHYTAIRFDLRITMEDRPSNDAVIPAAEADDPEARGMERQGGDTGSPVVSAGSSQKVTYILDPNHQPCDLNLVPPADKTAFERREFSFYVPARNEPWHWMFYSCNGFGTDTKNPEKVHDGIRPLWRDVLQVNDKRPMHLMFGCGDQIYNDDLFFHCQSLRKWLDITYSEDREKHPFTEDMRVEVERYYFMHYIAHFSEPVLCDAMARIPGMNVADDHDLWDGFGSYPDALNQCPVFTAMGEIALRYFLLFQQHTTVSRARSEGFWAGTSKGNNYLRLMGPRTAIFGGDQRSERSRSQICDPKTWDILFEKLQELPETVEHLIFAAGVPISFPALGLTEMAMEIIGKIRRWSGFRKAFRYSGLYKKLGLAFGEPSNLDDLIDHWNSAFHIVERNKLIERMQQFSEKSSIRITIISGDVHCAAVAQLRTQGKFDRATKHTYDVPPIRDQRLMYNVISSAIGNIPPPKPVLKLFQYSSSRRPVRNVENTTEGLVHVFQHDVDGKRNKKGHRKIMARRNWCEVDEIAPRDIVLPNVGNDDTPAVTPEISVFRLRFEPPKDKPDVGVGVYHVSVPRLVCGWKAEKHPHLAEIAIEQSTEMGLGVGERDEKVADTDVGGRNDQPGRLDQNEPEHGKVKPEVDEKPQQQPKNDLKAEKEKQHTEPEAPAPAPTSAPAPAPAAKPPTKKWGFPIWRQQTNEWPQPVTAAVDPAVREGATRGDDGIAVAADGEAAQGRRVLST